MRTSTATLPTIWELLEEASATLPEPFSRAALLNWISARRPDVGIASIAAHLSFATDNARHSGTTPFAGRTPLLHRVDRGLYLRYRPAAGSRPAPEVPRSARVVLLGSSGAVAAAPAPAAELYRSPGFAAAREEAVRSGCRWFVLSSRHGLLEPGDVVRPVDDQLGDHSVGYRTAWGGWVAAQLAERMWLAGVVVEVHGGIDFAQPLRQPLARRGAALELPLPRRWQEEDADRAGRPGSEPAEAPRGAVRRLRERVTRHPR